jgi:hypothetical protein
MEAALAAISLTTLARNAASSKHNLRKCSRNNGAMVYWPVYIRYLPEAL